MDVVRGEETGEFMLRVALLCVTGLLLSACAMVGSNVTAFHRLTPEMTSGKTVAIEPGTNAIKDSLEFAEYRTQLAERFVKQGYVVVDQPEQAEWIAFLRYGIDDGKDVPYSYTTPQYGQIGGGTTYQSGTVSNYRTGSYGSYSGTSYTAPTYGVTGYTTNSGVRREYSRSVNMDILDRAALERGQTVKLYEGKVVSSGSCASLAPIFPAMADALFEQWPGESGKARRSEKILSGQCGAR